MCARTAARVTAIAAVALVCAAHPSKAQDAESRPSATIGAPRAVTPGDASRTDDSVSSLARGALAWDDWSEIVVSARVPTHVVLDGGRPGPSGLACVTPCILVTTPGSYRLVAHTSTRPWTQTVAIQPGPNRVRIVAPGYRGGRAVMLGAAVPTFLIGLVLFAGGTFFGMFSSVNISPGPWPWVALASFGGSLMALGTAFVALARVLRTRIVVESPRAPAGLASLSIGAATLPQGAYVGLSVAF